MDYRVGLHQRHELGIQKLDLVHLLADEERENIVGNGLRLLGRGERRPVQVAVDGDVRATQEVAVALLAHADDGVLETEGLELPDPGLGFFYDGVVEATAEAAVASDDDEGDLLNGSDLGERGVDVVRLELFVEVVEDLDEGLGEGAAADDGFLGPADLGGGDELHGLGDLLSVLDRVNAIAELAKAALDGGGGGGRPGGGGGGQRGEAEPRHVGARGERLGGRRPHCEVRARHGLLSLSLSLEQV